MSTGLKNNSRRKCNTYAVRKSSSKLIVAQTRPNAPGIPSCDSALFLDRMYQEERMEFEEPYPKSIYDDTSLHQLIVTRELELHGCWRRSGPHKGCFLTKTEIE